MLSDWVAIPLTLFLTFAFGRLVFWGVRTGYVYLGFPGSNWRFVDREGRPVIHWIIVVLYCFCAVLGLLGFSLVITDIFYPSTAQKIHDATKSFLERPTFSEH